MSPPAHLGKYLITGVIGEGAMGVVYRAEDPVIGRTVAIKTLSPEAPRRPSMDASPDSLRARFRHEARAVGRLSHPGIVAVHDFGEHEGTTFLVMEHVGGHNLSQWLARTPRLPLDTVVHLMDQLLQALEAVHAAGVCHRDIKPSNLLVTPQGRVKLTDFGIARIAGQDAEADDTAITGSPGYLAPEQYAGGPSDHRVDLFAAGVLMHRLLAGRAPFAGTPETAMRRTLEEDPPPVSVAAADPCLRGFDELVAAALQKRPDDRVPTAAFFRQALREAAGLAADPEASPAMPAFVDSGPGALDASTGLSATLPHHPVLQAPDFEPGEGSPEEAAWHQGVEVALDEVLGPIARLLMRRARRATRDPAGLVARLAASIADDVDRARFLRAIRHLGVTADPLATAAPTFDDAARPVDAVSLASPASPTDPLPAEAIGHALRVLTTHLGPEARTVIKGVAGRAGSTEEFHDLLVAGTSERLDRHLLARQLRRGPH